MIKYSNKDVTTILNGFTVFSKEKLKSCCKKCILKKTDNQEELKCNKCNNELSLVEGVTV